MEETKTRAKAMAMNEAEVESEATWGRVREERQLKGTESGTEDDR